MAFTAISENGSVLDGDTVEEAKAETRDYYQDKIDNDDEYGTGIHHVEVSIIDDDDGGVVESYVLEIEKSNVGHRDGSDR